ncbi:MAG: hypothetical protein ACSLFD_04970 [Solirubrobacterales bacterium]
MAIRPDGFSAYDDLLAGASPGSPWNHLAGEAPRYEPDLELLGRLLTVSVAAGESTESGRFAKGIDAWLAHELRRSGFGADEVWPRAERPRVLPRDIAMLLDKLPLALAAQVRERVAAMPSVAPADARVLGRAYDKQVDVTIARWDRGPELLLSTKAMSSGFGKNLGNRFEEAYGDAGNLRSRYPLAAVGFFFLQRSTILTKEPGAWERTKDMIRKLRDLGGNNGYTATGLALASWEDPVGPETVVTIELDRVPDDLGPAQFISAMVQHVLAVTPIVHHVQARERFERREIPVEATDVAESIVGDDEIGAEDLFS